MGDPAVEAAQRAWERWVEIDDEGTEGVLAVSAAREALEPIRSLFDRLALDYTTASQEIKKGMDEVLDPLRNLIFSTDELTRKDNHAN